MSGECMEQKPNDGAECEYRFCPRERLCFHYCGEHHKVICKAVDVESCPNFRLPAHFTFNPENAEEQAEIEAAMELHKLACSRCGPPAVRPLAASADMDEKTQLAAKRIVDEKVAPYLSFAATGRSGRELQYAIASIIADACEERPLAALREENKRLKQSVRAVLEGLRSGTHGDLCWCPEKHCPMATHLNCVHRQACLATEELWKQMERE